VDSLDGRKASRWARELVSGKEFVVLNSETTGLLSGRYLPVLERAIG
jgi:hypothetical protein